MARLKSRIDPKSTYRSDQQLAICLKQVRAKTDQIRQWHYEHQQPA